MYAVLETGSKQYRVTAGDTLEIERLAVEAGDLDPTDVVLHRIRVVKIFICWNLNDLIAAFSELSKNSTTSQNKNQQNRKKSLHPLCSSF